MDHDVIEILVVEDNPFDMELMLRAFKKRNINNPLHTVEDGAEALDFIFCRNAYEGRSFSRQPKVVLLDLKLPKVNGLEVLEAIKSDERTKSIPVVMVTSSQEEKDVTMAYALGANSYIVKPVEFDVFTDAMSNVANYWLNLNKRAF
jgi:two-component system response regulator